MALNIQLEVSEINTVLAALGKYSDGINALSLKIKEQGDTQIAAIVESKQETPA